MKLTRLLLILTIIFVPIIVRVYEFQISDDFAQLWPGWLQQVTDIDIFTYWKSQALWLLAALALVTACSHLKRLNLAFWLPFGTYFILLSLSTYQSGWQNVALTGIPDYNEGFVTISAYLALFLAAASTRDNYLLPAMTISTWIMGIICILQAAFNHWHIEHFFYPIMQYIVVGDVNIKITGAIWPLYGTLQNCNHLGTYCALLFPFVFVNFLLDFWEKNIIPLLLLLFMAVGCESRAAWLSIAISSVFCLFIARGTQWKAKCYGLLLFLFVVSLCLSSSIVGKLKPVLHDMRHPLSNSALSGRMYIWKNALPLLQRRIFLGKGPSTFVFEFPQNDYKGKVSAGWTTANFIDRPHNIYIQIWHASGLISLLALFILFFHFLTQSIQQLYYYPDKNLLAITASIIGYLAAGFFTDSFVGTAPIFWILSGSLVGEICLRQSKIDGKAKCHPAPSDQANGLQLEKIFCLKTQDASSVVAQKIFKPIT